MLKTRDFYLLKVYNLKGKYIGVIEDLAIDFYNENIKGFFISSFSIFTKKNFIKVEDIVSIEDVMIVKCIEKGEGLRFRSIKDMDIIDMKGTMKGVLEDFIIDKNNLSIRGLIMCSGIFDRIIKGKEVLLLKDCELGDECIVYIGNGQINVKSLPHNLQS